MTSEETKQKIVRREMVYAVGKEIGSGAEGAAHWLTRQDTGELFIAKVNKHSHQLSSAKEEAVRLKQYHHKNIVRYVDNFEDESGYGRVHLLIMENCNGGELRAFLKEHSGKKDYSDIYIKYFSDIVEGLAEIHARKQMHRDLKPENIFVVIVG